MARGGVRPGSGRKKGSKSKSTIEKERVLTAYREKIMKHADVLFKSQIHLAAGVSYLFKFVKGKQRPVLVTDKKEIEAFLLKDGKKKPTGLDKNATYYYITTERPDNKAIDSMLDRAFGKAVQPIGGDKDNPIVIKGVEIKVKKK